MLLKNIFLYITFLLIPLRGILQGDLCAQMEHLCTDYGAVYTSGGVTEVAEIGNNYGCLLTQPNPAWYYLEIENPGYLELHLSSDSDIDFIIWGPFDNLTEATFKCGMLGDSISSPIVDCSYSASSNETPEILSAASGEVYVLMITNYASIVQDIVIDKISGEATTVCVDNSPEPCDSHPGTFTGVQYGELLLLDEEIVLYHGTVF